MVENVEQSPFISFVNELDYSSTSIPRKYPRNERVTSAEEVSTMSKVTQRSELSTCTKLSLKLEREKTVLEFSRLQERNNKYVLSIRLASWRNT